MTCVHKFRSCWQLRARDSAEKGMKKNSGVNREHDKVNQT